MMPAYTCAICRDLGLVELLQGALRTIAKCRCEAGKNLANSMWSLPTIPVAGFEHKPFEAWVFKPTMERNYRETINWHREKIRVAEEFWKTQSA